MKVESFIPSEHKTDYYPAINRLLSGYYPAINWILTGAIIRLISAEIGWKPSKKTIKNWLKYNSICYAFLAG